MQRLLHSSVVCVSSGCLDRERFDQQLQPDRLHVQSVATTQLYCGQRKRAKSMGVPQLMWLSVTACLSFMVEAQAAGNSTARGHRRETESALNDSRPLGRRLAETAGNLCPAQNTLRGIMSGDHWQGYTYSIDFDADPWSLTQSLTADPTTRWSFGTLSNAADIDNPAAALEFTDGAPCPGNVPRRATVTLRGGEEPRVIAWERPGIECAFLIEITHPHCLLPAGATGAGPGEDQFIGRCTSSLSCRELRWRYGGWPDAAENEKPNSAGVCAESNNGFANGAPACFGGSVCPRFGECLSSTPSENGYADALATCGNIGARLCTREELLRNEARGTGCQHDAELVWTKEDCTDSDAFSPPEGTMSHFRAHWATAGSAWASGPEGDNVHTPEWPQETHSDYHCSDDDSSGLRFGCVEEACVQDDANLAVRCCADQDTTVAPACSEPTAPIVVPPVVTECTGCAGDPPPPAPDTLACAEWTTSESQDWEPNRGAGCQGGQSDGTNGVISLGSASSSADCMQLCQTQSSPGCCFWSGTSGRSCKFKAGHGIEATTETRWQATACVLADVPASGGACLGRSWAGLYQMDAAVAEDFDGAEWGPATTGAPDVSPGAVLSDGGSFGQYDGYTNNLRSNWRLTCTNGSPVLTIQRMDTEWNHDFLTVWADGTSQSWLSTSALRADVANTANLNGMSEPGGTWMTPQGHAWTTQTFSGSDRLSLPRIIRSNRTADQIKVSFFSDSSLTAK
eukprot:COSAG02_NODE_6210_length_3724_cov_6.572690_1_plen_740_part_10